MSRHHYHQVLQCNICFIQCSCVLPNQACYYVIYQANTNRIVQFFLMQELHLCHLCRCNVALNHYRKIKIPSLPNETEKWVKMVD